MKWPTAPVLALVVAAPFTARAEVPNRPLETLKAGATLAVTGAVKSIDVTKKGRDETRVYTIRVISCEKGGLQPGDEVRVSTWHTTLVPGTVGSVGHRGTPPVGRVTTVYADGSGAGRGAGGLAPGVYSVILPNGFVAAPPQFATPELLSDPATTPAQLDDAADKAAAAGAWEECEAASRKVVAKEPTPARRFRLAASLFGLDRAEDARAEARTLMEAAAPLAVLPKPAHSSYRAAFDAGDREAMAGLILKRAERTGTAAAWTEAVWALRAAGAGEFDAAMDTAARRLRGLGAPWPPSESVNVPKRPADATPTADPAPATKPG